MKILLVYPEYPNTFWSFKYALKFISKKASFPPLGLLTVASILPKAWEKKLVDMNVERLKDSDILWADYVFISAMSIQEQSSREIIKRVKSLNKKIVAGGPLFTARHYEFEDIDHFVLNEGELTLPEFIKDLEEGSLKNIYTSNDFADITKSPVPMHSLIDMAKYAAMNIQYSRGCPFDCEFCDITVLFGRKPRTKTVNQIISELDSIYSLGWRGGVFFVDDNFIGNKRHLKDEILPAIIDWMEIHNYPFTFNTQVSINLADDEELLKLMAKAGFTNIFVGIESPNDDSLEECNKNQNKRRDLLKNVRKLQSFGFDVQAGFILGFDNDPFNIFDKLIKFIEESNIITAMVGILNAPVGTRLYERLKKENRIIKYMTGDNTDFSTNILPKMGIEKLVLGYQRVVNTIYSPKFFYDRVIRFLKTYNPPQPKFFHLKFESIKALLKSMFILGIFEKGRLNYWKLFFWSLIKKPKLLSLSITFAIYGYHFRKIFSEHSKKVKGSIKDHLLSDNYAT